MFYNGANKKKTRFMETDAPGVDEKKSSFTPCFNQTQKEL